MTVMLFEESPGRDARSFGPHAVAVALANNTWVSVVRFQVPEGFVGRLRGWGFDAAGLVIANLTLRILVNGAPIPDYPDGITSLLGGMRAQELEEVWVDLPEKALVELQAYQSSGSAGTGDGRLKGMLWRAD